MQDHMVLHFFYSLLKLYGYDNFQGESSSLNFLAIAVLNV